MITSISLLQAQGISKNIGDTILFENISFGIDKDDKIGLIAKNGAGKSSLLRILAGSDVPDKGEISMKNTLSITYLEQEPRFQQEHTVLEAVLFSTSTVNLAIREYENALLSGNKNAIHLAHEKMDHCQAWDFETKIRQVLGKLNINNFNQAISELSGGQKKRVALAQTLLHESDLLILDEPTNHLDLEMVEWLESYLRKSKSAILIVTHDRYFLDRVCNHILELDSKKLFTYHGNYSYFLEKRDERVQNETIQIEKARNLFKKELDWIHRSPSARGTKAKYRIEAFYELEKIASQKTTKKAIEINLNPPRIGKKILDIHYISKSFGDKIILKDFSYRFAPGEKTGIIGRNGSGKTTLLNIIAGIIKADKGKMELGETVRIGYFKQEGIPLKEHLKVLDFLKEIAEIVTLNDGKTVSVSQFLNYFLFPPDLQQTPISKLSGGEKRRLNLIYVLMQNPNFLLLDEPTNDLDIITLNILEDFLQSYKGCVLIVSHDRFFLDKVTDHIFIFEGDGKIKDFPGNFSQYREYEALHLKNRKQTIESNKTFTAKKEPGIKKPGFKEKFELEGLEREIEELENEKTVLETELSSGKLKQADLTEKASRLGNIINSLEIKSNRWLELSEILEQ